MTNQAATAKKKSTLDRLGGQKFIVILVIIALFLFFFAMSSNFRKYTTIVSILDYSYYIALMAIGVTFPLITGGVDLSIGTGVICYALAGALMSRVSRKALEQDLAGMEFASGIPGTIGGAVFMNAGAYGSEMKDVLKEVTVLDDQLALRTISVEELQLGYRTSSVAKNGWLVLEAVLSLKKGDHAAIQRLVRYGSSP